MKKEDLDTNYSTHIDSSHSIKQKKKKKTVLLQGEDTEKGIFIEKFGDTPMQVDSTRVNSIEDQLKDKANISKIKTEDLVYYLKVKSQNNKLDANDMNKTLSYLQQIQISYLIENIFSNQTNYGTLATGFVLMLVPFYYEYPQFYKGGFWTIAIGLLGMSMVMQSLQKYSNIGKMGGWASGWFQKLEVWVLLGALIVYFVFFVSLCQLNHYSLFFISVIFMYLFVTFILRMILLSPIQSNPYKEYRATYQFNANAVPINTNIDDAAKELNERLNLGMPSGQMLYSYLAYFKIDENPQYIWDFISNLIQPIMIFGVLLLTGQFVNGYETLQNEIPFKTMPLVGMSAESLDFLECQANYILPDEMNPDKKIQEILLERCYDPELNRKMTGVLQQISSDYLKMYRPLFYYEDPDQSTNVFMTVSVNTSEIDDLREDIEDKKSKLTEQDEKVIRENIPLIESIMNDFCQEYEMIFQSAKSGKKLMSYDPKLALGKMVPNETSQGMLRMLFSILSPWVLFSKMVGSGWVFSKYIMGYWSGDMSELISASQRDWMIWKYASMGLDNFSIKTNLQLPWNPELNWMKTGMEFVIMLFVGMPVLATLGNTICGFSFSPKYINNFWALLLIGLMAGNLYLYKQGETLTKFNMIYVISGLVIMTAVSVSLMMKKENKETEISGEVS
jgi:hypothetical protein